MNDPEHQPRPKIKALAGERPFERNEFVQGPHHTGDRPLPGGQERPCARCGRMFQPSIKRRMLCAPCFGGGDGGGLAA